MNGRINLLDLNITELEDLLSEMGQEKFRAAQLFNWLGKGTKSLEEMSNIPKTLREELGKIAYIGKLKIARKLLSESDGTAKYLFELNDGNLIESVLMRYKYGLSVCVSSQAGCKMNCSFCASAGIGFIRNLTPGEMLDQVLTIQNDAREKIGHIVVMGIGEPLDNYDNLIKFLKLCHSHESLNIGYRRMTVSTCGLVPQILKLAEEKLPINLSISLHAPNDEIRGKLMPVNRKYSIDKLIEACKIYTKVSKRRITFEYALIRGVNDTKENAKELAQRLKGMLCHVNLIPLNPVEGSEYRQTNKKEINDFRDILIHNGIETTVRRELGGDIDAACGQLRRSVVNKDLP
ncbi:MAG TPA: 23S rRNA (adenine(2503)-C(2))-methyltransferase RlmN [Clostridiaceae bacterium]|nr:23S rRNA (adenine(2503)-C(2))-methyltransferase RlmN [Clostridiaceae bacterium]